ncbi:class I SAM-dependent methyltransferase, partial [Campylobacter lari]|nr:class I SAM-dependent methyltransferase [Campylobacter lari]
MNKKFISNFEISKNIGDNSQIWENIFANKEWGKYPSEYIIRFIARNFYNISNRKDINILELGLGTGANLWFCAREGFSVSGIEWSQSGVDRFLKRMKEENLLNFAKDIKIGDYFEKLDEFEDESFDCFIDNYSLAYNDFDKTKQIIEKVMKKLKSKAKFISATPSFNNLGFYHDENLAYHTCKPTQGPDAFTGEIRYCDDEDITSLYNGVNYKVDCVKTLISKEKDIVEKELYIIEGSKL